MKSDGETIKQPLFFETYNLAFTYAIMKGFLITAYPTDKVKE